MQYPTPMQDVNLTAMLSIGKAIGVEIGYSDHTDVIEIPIAAVALGATVIEKHITLDRSLPGPDHKASLEPEDLKKMVRAIRNIELALGDGEKRVSESEKQNIAVARKSLHAACDIPEGKIISASDLATKRPGDGISPMEMDQVIGKKAARAIAAGEKLNRNDLLT